MLKMIAARGFLQTVEQSSTLLRCSRLSIRALSTSRNIARPRVLQKQIIRLDIPRQTLSPHVVRPMSSASKFEVINIQDENDFNKRVVETSSTVPVVVDFHATWCGPCKILGPRLESLLSKEGGKVLMAKVDIDDHPELAMEYGVRSVPMVVGMKNGTVQSQFVGVKDDDEINTFVDKLVIS